jgi:phosphate-selective porin OprO and OprP
LVPTQELEQMRTRPLPAANAVWKPGTGILVQTADERFSMALRLRVQFRYELAHDQRESDTEQAFMIRRARMQLRGNVFGKHNKYYLQIAISPHDMGWGERGPGPSFTPIRNWEISFDYLRDLTLTVGQMKVPFNRQRVISSSDQQLVDRSLVTAEFNLDRDVGVMLSSRDIGGLGYLRYQLGVFNGEGRDAYRISNLGLLYVARLEVVPSGDAAEDWDYDEVDWRRKLRPSAVISGSYAYHDRATRERGSLGAVPLDGGSTNFHHAQADLMVKVAGLSLTSEFQYRKGTREFGDATVTDELGVEVPAPHVPARSGVGYYVQAGYLIPRVPVELGLRWGQTFGLGDGTQTSLPDNDEVGGGVSWYLGRHGLKLQADYFRLRRDRYDRATQSSLRTAWADGIDQVRIQLQLAF